MRGRPENKKSSAVVYVRRFHGALSYLICLLLTEPCLLAAPDIEIILVRNVSLIDRQNSAEGVLVNILIKNGKLEIITEEAVAKDDVSLVVDARRGFLIGKLSIGQPPSFMIFYVDPRENPDLLLDTKTHAVFAIQGGEIVKNMLIDTIDTSTQKAAPAKKSGWLAYTPPPIVLPLAFGESAQWNHWNSKYVSGIFIAALLVDRQWWLSQDAASEQQVGDLKNFESGELRGVRFGPVGTLNFSKPWVYTVMVASNAFERGFDADNSEGFSLFDYRLDIPLPASLNLSVGKQKEPFSMERLIPLFDLPMQERSAAADAMQRSRNVGAVLSGTVFSQRLSWAGGLFNDWIDSGESFDESSQEFVGRVTGLPFISEDESSLVHLGFGWRYTDAKNGLQFLTTPEFENSPTFVDTGQLDANSAVTYGLEATWRKGPIWIDGEYNRTDVDSPSLGDPVFTGYHIGASWAVSGEIRPYNRKSGTLGRLPVSTSVNQGGRGVLELALRWSELDLTDGLVKGGEMEILSLGLTWWLTGAINASVNYRHINLDRLDSDGSSDGLTARMTFLLE